MSAKTDIDFRNNSPAGASDDYTTIRNAATRARDLEDFSLESIFECTKVLES